MPKRKMRLVDVREPNLYRQTFPYTEFSKAGFDQQVVPLGIPDTIWITNTTFCDGQQARPSYTPQQILHVYDLLHKIDGGTGLIRHIGSGDDVLGHRGIW